MRKYFGFSALVAAFLVCLASVAGAQEAIDPTAEATSLATDAVGQLAPVMIAIAGVVITLAVLRFALRKGLSVAKGKTSA